MHRSVWLGESSRAPELWRHDRNVNGRYIVFLPIFQGQLAMFTDKIDVKTHVNVMKNINLKTVV